MQPLPYVSPEFRPNHMHFSGPNAQTPAFPQMHSLPQPAAREEPPQASSPTAAPLIGESFLDTLDSTSDKVAMFTLGAQTGRNIDHSLLSEFADTVTRMKYLAQKLDMSLAEHSC